MYATTATLDAGDVARLGRRPTEFLRLGRLAAWYDASHQQLAAVLGRQSLDVDRLAFRRWRGGVGAAWMWLFVLPSGQITAAVTVDVPLDLPGGGPGGTGLVASVPLLADLHDADLTVAGMPLPRHLEHLTADLGPRPGPFELLPERHQLVLARPPEAGTPSDEVVQRLVHRADLPTGAGSGRWDDEENGEDGVDDGYAAAPLRRPSALNHSGDRTSAALGPYVSVLVGLPGHVENAALLTAVQVVSAAARLRQIRQHTYDGVAGLRAAPRTGTATAERRLALEDVAGRLRTLELDLSHGVEAVADLGMLVPAARVVSYHQALVEALDLPGRAATTARMLERLANAVDAELTSVQSAAARAEDVRRTRTVAAVTFVTTTAGTAGLLFAFLGVNASEVQASRSMFDGHYLPAYLLVAAVVLGGLALFVALGRRGADPGEAPAGERPDRAKGGTSR